MKKKSLPKMMSFIRLTVLGILLQCFCVYGLVAKNYAPLAQTVSGIVKSSDTNEPLPGVNVLIKGTAVGTTTDADGKYSITADKGAVLSFSFVGYESSEVIVGEQTEVNISLAPDLKVLGEVLVVGYNTQSKRTITGAVSSINSKDLTDGSIASVERTLQGKIAGVNVSSEGTPGGGTMVRIRGFGTINNNDPLYVIDGIPTKGNLSSLSASDIESITVLKDASAASIYGSRAANGVVVITTKKGSAKNGGISVTVNRGIQSLNTNRFPEFMTPQQLGDAHRMRQVNNSGTFNHNIYGSNPNGAVLPDFVNPIGFQLDEYIVDIDGDIIGNVNQYDPTDDGETAPDGIFQLMRANKEGTDWFNEVFRTADFANVNVNYSGGTDKGTFYIGTEYFSQDGVAIHTNFDRYSARINSVGFAKDWLRLGESLNLNYSEGVGLSNQFENGVLAQLYRIPAIIPVYDVAGNFAGNQGNIGDARNPVAELTRAANNKNRTLRAFGNAYLEVDILKDLTAKSLVGIDYTTNNGTSFQPLNPGDYQSLSNNSFTESNSFSSAVIWTNTLNYNKDIGNHRVSALAGTEYIRGVYRQSFGTRQNYTSEVNTNEHFLDNGSGGFLGGNGANNILFSYFGKADYSFSDKYLASFTLRRDASSRFPEDLRWGTFPAASIGWVVSEEDFLKAIPSINMLKIRAGWGAVGNQDIPDPTAAATFFRSDPNYASYPLDGSNNSSMPGFDKYKRGNQQVTWESTETLNIGIDAEIFRSIGVTFEWFKKETKDMLVDIRQPATAGAAADAFLNVGNVENKGIELGIDYSSDRSKTFRYSIGANVSTYKNTIKKLNSAPFYGNRAFDLIQMTVNKEGESISSFYGFMIDGIFQNDTEVEQHVFQDGARPGTFKFRNMNGDTLINDLDRTIIGSPHPDFTYGINLNLGYKAFDLSVSATGSQGNEIFNATRYFTDFFKMDGNRSIRLLNSWTPENTDTEVPQLNANDILRESQESTYYIEDGSYLRVRSVQFSYNFPRNILGNVLSSAKIYFLGQNLFTLTNYSGLDPEINVQNFSDPKANRGIGVDRGAYPIPRTFSLGFTATF
jgi:TonB-linked SusC/RagA family outer membrane protein